jgi:hypothetical protein
MPAYVCYMLLFQPLVNALRVLRIHAAIPGDSPYWGCFELTHAFVKPTFAFAVQYCTGFEPLATWPVTSPKNLHPVAVCF